jgi:hypothetical protein
VECLSSERDCGSALRESEEILGRTPRPGGKQCIGRKNRK